MRNGLKVLAVVLLGALLVGCAVASRVSELRHENRVIYRCDETGKGVTVNLDESLVYKEMVTREFRGVTVKGYLFKGDDSASVLVTRMPRTDFETLLNKELDAPKSGVTLFPPRTILAASSCELVRAYVGTLEDDVVAAVRFRKAAKNTFLCETWTTIDDVMAHDMSLVSEFDMETDRLISMDEN